MAHVEQAISSNRGTGVYLGNDILSLNSSGGPNTTYKDGEFVGIPGVGQLGVRIEGGQTFVNTRINRYLVPSHLTTREEISAWVINSYRSRAISGHLYPMHTSQGAGQVSNSGGPNTTYKDGEFVGIPGVGQLGVRIEGGQTFVNTRINRYLVPSHLTTREEISAWVINSYRSRAISGHLYPMHTSQGAGQVAVGQPFTTASSPYSAVGFNRALSTMTDVARKGIEIALNKFPMAQRVLRLLDQFLPKSGPDGTSDVLRIEVNTNLNDPSSNVVHFKLNLAQLLQLGLSDP